MVYLPFVKPIYLVYEVENSVP